MSRVWIGTSGWTYDGWRGPFYPPKLAKKHWLCWYAGQFPTTEINGSFYRTPSPDAKACVEVGQTVKEGQTICIIEAMKLMNEIETDAGGVVKAILVENGQPVEYGQPLFILG